MIIVKSLGRREYLPTWRDMRAFTERRHAATADEIWVVEHPPVYTQGAGCRDLPAAGCRKIPVVRTDRGGKMTYHGPGQLVAYLLFDLKRMASGPRAFVRAIESRVIEFLARYGVAGATVAGAPGVYVAGKKIAALGLRISRGRSYHGLSLNVDMDLEPFRCIVPCGIPDLEVTNLCQWSAEATLESVSAAFVRTCREDGLFP